MSLQDDIGRLIESSQRRLQKLKEQKAITGSSTPPEILIEIEDVEADIAELQKSFSRANPSYYFVITSPRTIRTITLPGPGYRTYGISGAVNPKPKTGVWVIRETDRPPPSDPTINQIDIFEADVAGDGSWECRIEFSLLPRRTEMLYRVRAVVPSRDGRLLFRHHLENRDKIDDIIAEAQEHGLDIRTSYVPFTEYTLPSFLAETPLRQVILRKNSGAR